MKFLTLILSVTLLLFLTECKTSNESVGITYYTDSLKIDESESLSIRILKGKAFNHPTFVIWKEDLNGNYLRTIFITKSYATGIFGHAALTDSTWDNKPGESVQASALPYWTHKKGLINNTVLVPTKKHPFIDGYSGATPTNNFQFTTKSSTKDKPYKILLEVNQTWDWNTYWTNNKYPNNTNYKHSAQPSLIYAVTINKSDSLYYMNPVGHGNPKGENGKLFTDLSTLSSAKEIFKSITITIE